MKLLAIRNLTVKYHNGIEAIRDLNMEVSKGEFVTILGPSGCGKTTLLDVLAGLVGAEQAEISGDLIIDGIDRRSNAAASAKPRIGYVFERHALLPWRTVIENIELGLLIEGKPKDKRRERSRELLKMINLQDFEECYPDEISAGMRQRVSFARTLAYEPDLVLMDEPFGALDTETRLTLQSELLRLWEKTKVTILLVTHDVFEAVTLGNRVIMLSRRPARSRKEFWVDIPYPRDPYAIRSSREYSSLTSAIWQLLSKETQSD